MNQIVLEFNATGTGHCLYTEAIPLQTLGRLHISRATSIEFNHPLQQWEVVDLQGQVLHRSGSRQSCLDWEHAFFNR